MIRRIIYGPPGTGKTTTLVGIINELVEGGVYPGKICVLSFSKAASITISRRLIHQIGFVGTIHSLCHRLMIRGHNGRSLMSSDDVQAFLDNNGFYSSHQISSAFLSKGDEYVNAITMFDDKLPPDDFFKVGSLVEYKTVLQNYLSYKKANDLFTFNELLSGTTPSVTNSVNYDYLILDEAQDLNVAQWDVIRNLAKNMSGGIIVAGDDDQTIYKFLGADPRLMVEFAEEFKLDSCVLSQSYRVPRSVHSIANTVIKTVKSRVDKEYFPRPDDGRVFMNVLNQSSLIGINPKCCVLVRIGGLLGNVGRSIIMSGAVPSRFGLENSCGFGSWFIAARLWYKKKLDGMLAVRYIRPHITEEGLMNSNASWDRAIKINKFDLDRLHKLRLVYTDEEIFDGKIPVVQCGTIHSAKGMEFDHVILIDSFCGKAKQNIQIDRDTEARVAYVGATRAKKTLSILEWKDPFITPMIPNLFSYMVN